MAQAMIGALRVTLSMDSAAFEKGLKQAESKLATFGKRVSSGLFAVGAAAATAGAGVALSVRSALNAADDMAKAARKIGIPIEDLSRLKHAADLSGVSFSGLQGAVRRLSANMLDASTVTGEARAAFERLGISVTTADGSLKSSSTVLAELAGRFAAMPDGAEKTALALDLMGRAGADMIPLLNGGTTALEDMMAEADSLGLVFTEEMGRNAEAFNDNMTRLGKAFTVIGRQLAAELAPHLAALSDWLVQNAPAIVSFTASLVDFAAGLVRDIAQVVRALQDGFAAFEAWWQGGIDWRNRIQSEIAALASSLISTFAALPEQMLEIGGQMMQGLLDGLSRSFDTVKAAALSKMAELKDSITGFWSIRSPSKVMQAIGVQLMQGLGTGMESLRGSLTDTAQSLSSSVANAFSGVVTGAQSVEDALKGLIKQLNRMLLNAAFQNLFGAASSSFGFSGLLGGAGLGKIGVPLAAGFAGMFAGGGVLGAGEWGIAGEAGPELVVGPARVVPSGQSFPDGPQTIIHMTVQTPDIESFRRSEGQLGGQLVDAYHRGQRGR